MPLSGSDLPRPQLDAALRYVAEHRAEGAAPIDVVVTGRSEPDDAASLARVAALDGTATWWLEELSPLRYGVGWEALGEPWDVERLRARVLAGPPST